MKSKPGWPDPIPLDSSQITALQPYIKKFKEYAASTKGKEEEADRRKKVEFFQHDFPSRIPQLSEADLVDLVAHLWAAQIWGNKQYLVQQILTANGLEKIKANLKQLWNTTIPVAQRYDEFVKNIAHLGPAAVSEMLCCIQPTRCGIWNQIAREALKSLKFTDFVSLSKYQITGNEYETFNQVAAAIALQIEKAGLSSVDLLLVDYFLWEVSQAQDQHLPETGPVTTGNHDEICEMIAGIGAMLGFDVSTEVTIAAGARVDVLWRSRIGNLGSITYIFEVQSGGSTDSLILNLQKAKSNPTVQKVVAVSDDIQLSKIQKETEGLPGEFTKALSFWKVDQVRNVSQHLQAAMSEIEKLGLTVSKH